MSLDKRIEKLRKDVSSDRLSMSIGELAGLYERGELDIHPKFQRVLRWSTEQKSKLIESILLRIPVPPLFVAQDANGHWDVVDGVQRLGTIFEFLGILKDHEERPRPALALVRTELLPELEGMCFESTDSSQASMPQAYRLDFRRSRLDLHVILKESDPSAKYELFERLNTGGSIASPQEVRNCVLVWINEPLFDWIQEIGQDPNFVACVPLSERLEEEEYRTELVLRFLTFYQIDEDDMKSMRDVAEFLNISNRAMALDKKFSRRKHKEVFQRTFALINQTCGADAFRKFGMGTFTGAFLISAFEAVAYGVAHNIDRWIAATNASAQLRTRIEAMWRNVDFTQHIGTGVAARPRMQRTIPFGRTHFVP